MPAWSGIPFNACSHPCWLVRAWLHFFAYTAHAPFVSSSVHAMLCTRCAFINRRLYMYMYIHVHRMYIHCCFYNHCTVINVMHIPAHAHSTISRACATGALENGVIQYTSRHNKMDMTTVITALLVQINSALTTTHQCVTRDIMDKNGRYAWVHLPQLA